jgi:hypothetical protein
MLVLTTAIGCRLANDIHTYIHMCVCVCVCVQTFTIQGSEARNEEDAHRLRGIAPRVIHYLFSVAEREQQRVCGIALPALH